MSAAADANDGLRISELTVEYRSGDYVVRAVDQFSCEVADGSLVLLLGPSGSGKTTLLSCLAGILQPSSGTISHAGREVTGLSGSELVDHRRSGVGVVFQSFNLIASLSAMDNVALPLRIAGVPRGAARARSQELLESFELGDRVHHHPSELSGGEQQRVAIARALAPDPPLLLADEPTAHLDLVQLEATLRILRRLASPGRVVVVVTHDDRLLPLADQVIELVPRQREAPTAPTRRDLEAGEVLFAMGDPSDVIYMVERGEIEITRERGSQEEEILALRGPGDYFGEMGPLFGLPRSATARATLPTLLTGVSVNQFREALGIETLDDLVRRHPVPTGHPTGSASANTRPIRVPT